jgi:anti-sigma factor (TIGR02949 family)
MGSSCDELRLKALRYLDDRLHGQELDDFRTHVEACSNCRANVETELALSELLHRSRPLYSATPRLRARVAAAIDQRPASIVARESFQECLDQRVKQNGSEDLATCWDLRSSWIALIAADGYSRCMAEQFSEQSALLLFDHAFQGNFPRAAMLWRPAPCGSPCHQISFHLHFNVN